MAFVNFNDLQSVAATDTTDQLLLGLTSVPTGSADFGRIQVQNFESSLGVYATVQSNSAQWATDSTADAGVRALTGNWQNTYINFSAQSPDNVSVYSTVQTNSATTWNYQGTDIKALTANWQNTYTDFSAQSAANASVYSTVNSKSANWDSVYIGFNTQSAANASVYSTVNTNSGSWGLMIFREISSTVSPNTATIVHALSVASVSANVDIALIAKGNGATIAQIPDNTTTGGNKRGTQATDFQKQRSQSSQVASGSRSFIGGGQENTSSAANTVVCGGVTNTASNTVAVVAGGTGNVASGEYASVAGGFYNSASANSSCVAGGVSNTASAMQSNVAGGTTNTASGVGSSVGGGSTNIASSSYSTIAGGYGGRADRYGMRAHASSYFNSTGDAQGNEFNLYARTTDSSVSFMYLDGYNGTLNRITKNNAVFLFFIQILGVDEAYNVTAKTSSICVKNNINTYNLDVIAINDAVGSSSSGAGTVSFVIDDGVFKIQVTGVPTYTTNWVAHVRGTELLNV